MSQKATAKDIVTGNFLMIKEVTDKDREVVYKVCCRRTWMTTKATVLGMREAMMKL
jgi:hypothetical protein